MDKCHQISTKLLPLIHVENWFPCSISRIFWLIVFLFGYELDMIGGLVWDCRWVNFIKLARSYYL